MGRWVRLALFYAVMAGVWAGVVRAEPVREYAYGAHELQRLDVYGASPVGAAPVIVMLHGGGWQHGDKANAFSGPAKAAYFLPRGYLFVSVNTRLLPEADPVEQAGDLARALAFVQARAAEWGGDASRLVLMGHSAGAHVAGLVTAREDLRARAGLRPWLGSVLLDSAAYDVPFVMQGRPSRLYTNAFGKDRLFWESASPMAYLGAGDMPILAVCSLQRRLPCPEAERLAETGGKLGGAVTILPVDLSHRGINVMLGAPSVYTDAVDDWLAGLGLP